MKVEAVPARIRRWSEAHAWSSLAALILSAFLSTPLPSVLWGLVSLVGFFMLQREPTAKLGGWGYANTLTLLRLCGTGIGTWLFWRDTPVLAGILAVCFALDGVDGWVARRWEKETVFGAMFDMETDAYLIALLCLVLVVWSGFGLWMLIPGALRYLLVIARSLFKPAEAKERGAQFSRIVFFVLASSLLIACLPALRFIATPLLVLSVAGVCVSFAPDFLLVVQGALARGQSR